MSFFRLEQQHHSYISQLADSSILNLIANTQYVLVEKGEHSEREMLSLPSYHLSQKRRRIFDIKIKKYQHKA